jgi:hypothetical protein
VRSAREWRGIQDDGDPCTPIQCDRLRLPRGALRTEKHNAIGGRVGSHREKQFGGVGAERQSLHAKPGQWDRDLLPPIQIPDPQRSAHRLARFRHGPVGGQRLRPARKSDLLRGEGDAAPAFCWLDAGLPLSGDLPGPADPGPIGRYPQEAPIVVTLPDGVHLAGEHGGLTTEPGPVGAPEYRQISLHGLDVAPLVPCKVGGLKGGRRAGLRLGLVDRGHEGRGTEGGECGGSDEVAEVQAVWAVGSNVGQGDGSQGHGAFRRRETGGFMKFSGKLGMPTPARYPRGRVGGEPARSTGRATGRNTTIDVRPHVLIPRLPA